MIPDLLALEPQPGAAEDEPLLAELLEMSFLGRAPERDLEGLLAPAPANASSFDPRNFRDDLFVDALVARLHLAGAARALPLQRRVLAGLLCQPPSELATIHFRQGILHELWTNPALADAAVELHGELFTLLGLFKAPREGHWQSFTTYRIETLRQVRRVIDRMAEAFPTAQSGLSRLAVCGRRLQGSPEYDLLTALLDFDSARAEIALRVRLGGDGKIRSLELDGIRESRPHPFLTALARRWGGFWRMLRKGYQVSGEELANRLVVEVYQRLAPALRPLLRVLGHLELYLAALGLAEDARAAGLAVCLPRLAPVGGGAGLPQYVALWNPLLLTEGIRPVPSDLGGGDEAWMTLLTGPNSGGKTRTLQAIGLAQLLAQSGLFVPAREAHLPLVPTLFAALGEHRAAGDTEGRLGSELLRIRELFATARPGGLVLIDELCSGTNPAEAREVIEIVLRLLAELRPAGFVTTHFLDYMRALAANPPVPGLRFLQVATGDDGLPTYRLVPGVAATSLAASTARRLGVDLDTLRELLQRPR
jgi:DNA mismatch repair protein MutS2